MQAASREKTFAVKLLQLTIHILQKLAFVVVAGIIQLQYSVTNDMLASMESSRSAAFDLKY